MRLRCRIGFHRWGPWSLIPWPLAPHAPVVEYRWCLACRKSDYREF